VNNPIVLHVNYVEQGQSIPEMCDLAVAWGYDGIEFRRKRGGVEESSEEYLDAIAGAREKSGLRMVLFGGPGPDLMNPDAETREREVEECLAFYKLAAERFDLTVCNTTTGSLTAEEIPYYHFDKHGSAIATEEHWEWAAEGFQRLGDCASDLGFRFAFETHNCYLHDLPKPTLELLKKIDRRNVGVNFDYGNILIHPDGGSLSDAIRTLADHIYEVHLKNVWMLPGQRYFNFIPCGLGDGAINNREFLRELKAIGYTGPLAIEAPRQGDREHYAKQDIAYLRQLMAEVG